MAAPVLTERHRLAPYDAPRPGQLEAFDHLRICLSVAEAMWSAKRRATEDEQVQLAALMPRVMATQPLVGEQERTVFKAAVDARIAASAEPRGVVGASWFPGRYAGIVAALDMYDDIARRGK